jgi:hypothetical protein
MEAWKVKLVKALEKPGRSYVRDFLINEKE